MNTSYSDRRTF